MPQHPGDHFDFDSAGVYFMAVEEFESRSAPADAAAGADSTVRHGRRAGFALRAVGIEFLEAAPMVTTTECDVRLPRLEVWKALVDADRWPLWFPGVRRASYRGSPPYGVGTVRIADVAGCHFEETMLAWEDGRRWAYRIDRAGVPLAKAQVECTELEDCGAGTRVRWTLAVDPGFWMRPLSGLFRWVVRRILVRAMRNLEKLTR